MTSRYPRHVSVLALAFCHSALSEHVGPASPDPHTHVARSATSELAPAK